jgi:hypothetical protein
VEIVPTLSQSHRSEALILQKCKLQQGPPSMQQTRMDWNRN